MGDIEIYIIKFEIKNILYIFYKKEINV